MPPTLPALSCCSSSPTLPSTLSVSLSFPAQLPATKPPGCKTFWKRCQGLLGNTWGSLKRKRKPPRQLVEEVMSLGKAACRAEWLHGVNPPATDPPGCAAVPCQQWFLKRGETLPVLWASECGHWGMRRQGIDRAGCSLGPCVSGFGGHRRRGELAASGRTSPPPLLGGSSSPL